MAVSNQSMSYRYLILDNMFCTRGSKPENGCFLFRLHAQSTTGDNHIGIYDLLENIIEVKISPFLFPKPYFPSFAGQSPTFLPEDNNISFPLIPVTRVGLSIKEFGYQGYPIPNGITSYFEFEVEDVPTNPNLVKLIPINDKFIFDKPIRLLPEITLQFLDPINPLPLQLCKTTAFADTEDNHIVFTKPVDNILFKEDQQIIINKFVSEDPVLKNYINRPIGHLIKKGTTSKKIIIKPQPCVKNLWSEAEIQIPEYRFRIPLQIKMSAY
uniref:PH240R homolog protein n=1 Tax=Abalone asfa-like virus TaxID=2839893 RepID=A0A5K7XX17_9VIRU|nr:pH240R homolog protein [Abalone asfa-like virus]BCY04619.1 hypothetical protein [Abalone asfa-like virus]